MTVFSSFDRWLQDQMTVFSVHIFHGPGSPTHFVRSEGWLPGRTSERARYDNLHSRHTDLECRVFSVIAGTDPQSLGTEMPGQARHDVLLPGRTSERARQDVRGNPRNYLVIGGLNVNNAVTKHFFLYFMSKITSSGDRQTFPTLFDLKPVRAGRTKVSLIPDGDRLTVITTYYQIISCR